MLTNIKGVIFDLDGTIIDSMWVWSQLDIDYLEIKGHSMPETLRSEISHLNFYQTAVLFKDKFKLSDSIEKILSDWHNMAFNYYAKKVKLKSGVIDFLENLKSNKIKIALATSNSLPLLEVCLKNNGIYDYFDSITTTDEVSNGKNFPDIYFLAAKKIGIPPKNCLVFEDILPAIQGAKAANMKVVAVKDSECLDSKEELLKYADAYIDSFLDLL